MSLLGQRMGQARWKEGLEKMSGLFSTPGISAGLSPQPPTTSCLTGKLMLPRRGLPRYKHDSVEGAGEQKLAMSQMATQSLSPLPSGLRTTSFPTTDIDFYAVTWSQSKQP